MTPKYVWKGDEIVSVDISHVSYVSNKLAYHGKWSELPHARASH